MKKYIVFIGLIISSITSASTIDCQNLHVGRIWVEKGTGYRPVLTDEIKDESETIGLIKLDASFSPIKKVSYTVESARVENRTDLDKLVVDLETDGTIEPESAIKYAGAILQNQLSIFVDLTRVQEQQKAAEGVGAPTTVAPATEEKK